MGKIRQSKFFRWAVIASVVILLAAGTVAFLHIRSVHKDQQASGTIPTSKKAQPAGNSSKSQGTGATKSTPPAPSGNKAQGAAVTDAAGLVAPFGSFVSNHRPGQGGSPLSEESVCNTTPGATCDIQFTNSSGVVKSLGAETVDGNGTAYWSWNVDGGTLAPGSWRITAVVKLNGQSKTTSDPTPLEVQ